MLSAIALIFAFHSSPAVNGISQKPVLMALYHLAPITMKVDATDGESISGIRAFKVTVNSGDAIVTKVEEYINGQLTTTQSSTPYMFMLDTLDFNDGPITVKFIAYTDSGAKVSKALKLGVNNEVSKGAAYHVQLGQTDLENGQYDNAILQGRIALKGDKHSDPAKLLVAKAYLLTKVYDKAQTLVEDVLADDPKNMDALDLAGVIGIDDAFNIYDTGTKDSDAMNVIAESLKFAVTNRKTLLDDRFSALNSNVTDSKSAIAYGASACSANHFSDAIQVLNAAFSKDESNTSLANWLTYAQLRAGRITDAVTTLDVLKRAGSGTFDGYIEAIDAILLTIEGHPNKADDSMSNAILDDMSNLGVRTAQASIALQEGKTSNLSSMLNSLVNDAGQLTEVNYLVSSLENKMGNYDLARKYMIRSLQADPANYLMYVEAGNQVIGGALNSAGDKNSKSSQYKVAELFFKTALLAKGDSFEALTGLSIAYALEGRSGKSLSYAQAAVSAQPTYAAGEYAVSMAYGLLSGDQDASLSAAAANKAGELDSANLSGVTSPSPGQCWLYFSTTGRTLVISAPPLS